MGGWVRWAARVAIVEEWQTRTLANKREAYSNQKETDSSLMCLFFSFFIPIFLRFYFPVSPLSAIASLPPITWCNSFFFYYSPIPYSVWVNLHVLTRKALEKGENGFQLKHLWIGGEMGDNCVSQSMGLFGSTITVIEKVLNPMIKRITITWWQKKSCSIYI